MSENRKNQLRSKEEIIRMKTFYEEGRSFSEVGDEFGISPSRVEQIFRQNNIATRSKTVSKKFLKMMNQRRLILDERLLSALYTEERLSIQKIADKLNSTYDLVRRNLQNHDIPIRPRENYTRSRLKPGLLKHLYIEKNLTAAKIAERLGYSTRTIVKKLSKFGIAKFGRSSASPDPPESKFAAGNAGEEKVRDDSVPAELWTVDEIAGKYSLHPTSVRKLINKGVFPNAFRQTASPSFWLVPASDLDFFTPRRKGVERIAAPTDAAIRSRGKYARAKIKKSHGYGKKEVLKMIDLEKQNYLPEEIAVKFRLDEKSVADLLAEAALKKYRPKKPAKAKRELKVLSKKHLIDLYVNGKDSTAEIIKQLDTNYFALYNSLRHYGLPVRDERLRLLGEERRQEFHRLFVEEKLSPEVIAERLGLTAAYVKRKISELKRRLKMLDSGEPSPDSM